MAEIGLQIRRFGITSLWFGALATAAAAFVGHYPVRGSSPDSLAETDIAASGLQRTTISKNYFRSRIPKACGYCDKHSSGFALA
jgi:hypothetical protein